MRESREGLPGSCRVPGRTYDEQIERNVRQPPPVADINVTPMVDVMLVLLIIFMVITPMLSKGVSVDMVKTKNPIAMQAADKSDAVDRRGHPRWQGLSWAPPRCPPEDLPPR